jgi:hypothetical protein
MWNDGVIWTELQSNASGYEVQSSKPDDASVRAIWTGWAVFAVLSTLSSAMVVTIVLSSKKVRASIFNVYLAALPSAEFFMSLNFAITCLLNVAHGGYLGRVMCEYQVLACPLQLASALMLPHALPLASRFGLPSIVS